MTEIIKVRLKDFFSIQNIVFLHFAIFSTGLLGIAWNISRYLYRRVDLDVLLNHLCDWIEFFKHNKLPQLIFFGLSLCALIVFYAFNVFVISCAKQQKQDDDRWGLQALTPSFWLGYFVFTILLNLSFVFLPKVLFFTVWLISFSLLPAALSMQKIQEYSKSVNNKFKLGLRGCWVTVGVISLIFVVIFFPLIFKPLQVANDFMDIPEQTILHHGLVVDNTQFVNEHRIGGFHLYDPRVGLQSSPLHNVAAVSIPKNPLLILFLAEPKHRPFSYNDEIHLLSVREKMRAQDYSDLQRIYQDDSKSRGQIDALLLHSHQIESFYKTRVYTQEEQEFIDKNFLEINAKIKSGWFFFHHSWVLNPILALSLGARAEHQVFLYGWGCTVFLKNVLSLLGSVSFQNYFQSIFAFYPIYFFVFLAAVYGIFRRVDYVCIGAFLLSTSVLLLSYKVILLAPGYNPIRHLFDMSIILMFYRYLQKNQVGYLLAAIFVGFISILWSKDFGLFLLLSLVGTGSLKFLTTEKFLWRKLLFWVATPIVGLILYGLPYHGVNYNLIYMLLGYTIPPTSSAIIFFVLGLLSLFYLMFIKYKNTSSAYYWLALCLFFYVQLQLIYYIWNPSYHHLLVLAPAAITFGLTWRCFLTEDKQRNIANQQAIGLIASSILFGMYGIGLLSFYMGRIEYEKIFSTHVVHNWSFQYGKFQTTMQPQLFEETIQLIHRHETHPSMYIISKYDSILPVLAHRYNAFPVVNLILDLISYVDIERCVQVLRDNKPQYIFVDTDIQRDHRSDLLEKYDSMAAHGNYYESYGRVSAHNNVRQLFLRIQNDYEPIEKGRLLTVYQRKPGV